MLDFEELFQDLFLLLPVGHERVATAVPLNVVTVQRLPGGKDLDTPQSQTDLGRIRVCGSDATNRRLVGALAHTGQLVHDQNVEARSGHGVRCRGADAARADDDCVKMLPGHSLILF